MTDELRLSLNEIREVISLIRPPDYPGGHGLGLFYENGKRDMCDELLKAFSEDES